MVHFNSDRDALLAQAADHLAAGDEQEAIALYDRLLQDYPDDAEAHCMRGVALRMLGNRMLEAAWHAYERSIQEEANYPKPHFQLIRLAQSLDRLEYVIRTYKQRILQNRVEPKNYAYLGFALLTAGDVQSALQVVETGLAIGPTDAYLHYIRGEILRAKGDLLDAIGAWEQALEHDRSLVDALYSLAEAHEEAGNLHDAIENWQRLTNLLVEQGAPRRQIIEVRQRTEKILEESAKNRFAAGSGGLEPFS